MTDLLTSPNVFPNAKIIFRIDDSEDGTGGRAMVSAAITANASYDTVLKIDSISNGRIRFDISGGYGTWRSSAGTYTESIGAGAGSYISIAFDSYTVAEVDFGGSSVQAS